MFKSCSDRLLYVVTKRLNGDNKLAEILFVGVTHDAKVFAQMSKPIVYKPKVLEA